MQRLPPLRRVLASCASAVEGAAKAASAHEYQTFRLFASAHEGPPKEAVSAIPFKVPGNHLSARVGRACSYYPLSWLDAHCPAQARRCHATRRPRHSCSTTAPTPCLCSPPQVCARTLAASSQAPRGQAKWQRVPSAEKVKESYLPFWVATAHVEVELRWADCGCAFPLPGASADVGLT